MYQPILVLVFIFGFLPSARDRKEPTLSQVSQAAKMFGTCDYFLLKILKACLQVVKISMCLRLS